MDGHRRGWAAAARPPLWAIALIALLAADLGARLSGVLERPRGVADREDHDVGRGDFRRLEVLNAGKVEGTTKASRAEVARESVQGALHAEVHALREEYDGKFAAQEARWEARIAEAIESGRSSSSDSGRRHLQRDGAADVGAREVQIYTRSMTRVAPQPGRGRRRGQEARLCSAGAETLATRQDEVTSACCNLPGEDCSHGAPATCTQECAAVLLPFWGNCQHELAKPLKGAYHAVLEECQDAIVDRAGMSEALQLLLTCTDGADTASCVPPCSSELHGDLLLANSTHLCCHRCIQHVRTVASCRPHSVHCRS